MNAISKPKVNNKFYAIKKGRKTGIFRNYKTCEKYTSGFKGSEYRVFKSKEEAEQYLREKSVDSRIKYYAVKVGRKPGIYGNVQECLEQVNCFPGSEFRKFTTFKAAEKYMSKPSTTIKKPSSKPGGFVPLEKGEHLIAYVDGSYDSHRLTSISSAIIFPEGREKEKVQIGKWMKDGNAEKLKNVAGEIAAAMEAIKYCLDNSAASLILYYDYDGIGKLGCQLWAPKTLLAEQYVSLIKEARKKLDITFVKVKAHSGDKYNTEADKACDETKTLIK